VASAGAGSAVTGVLVTAFFFFGFLVMSVMLFLSIDARL
jgi:hypothetical protein